MLAILNLYIWDSKRVLRDVRCLRRALWKQRAWAIRAFFRPPSAVLATVRTGDVETGENLCNAIQGRFNRLAMSPEFVCVAESALVYHAER